MNILLLGGTRFVGQHIALALLQAGHRVTLLTRRRATDHLPAEVERLHGDRDEGEAGLSELQGRHWDACIDVSGYKPGQVRASTEMLKNHVGWYVFISTASVYAEQNRSPIRESDPLLPPLNTDASEINFGTYGPMKVACEQLVQENFGANCTILRPQLVAGPYDYTPRYPYWPDRVARGGQILIPGDGTDFFQVIDARDLARFTVTVTEKHIPGIFNVSGPRLTWAEFLGKLGATNLRWASLQELEKAGIAADQFPIFIPVGNAQDGLMNMDNSRALAAGLTLTDPAVTARETREWSKNISLNYTLTPEREAELMQLLHP